MSITIPKFSWCFMKGSKGIWSQCHILHYFTNIIAFMLHFIALVTTMRCSIFNVTYVVYVLLVSHFIFLYHLSHNVYLGSFVIIFHTISITTSLFQIKNNHFLLLHLQNIDIVSPFHSIFFFFFFTCVLAF